LSGGATISLRVFIPLKITDREAVVLALGFVPNQHMWLDVFSSTIQASIGAVPWAVSPISRSGLMSNYSSTRSIMVLMLSTSAFRGAGVGSTSMITPCSTSIR